MDTKRVLYFLAMLNRETNGHSDEIAEIYKRALDENDDVIRLKMLLNDTVPYGTIGNALFENGKQMLEKLYSMPAKALDIIIQLRHSAESIESAVSECDELMHSPLPFSKPITILKKKDTIAYMTALRMIAGTCVYLITLYAGLGSTEGLTWSDTAGMRERTDAVNTKFIPALLNVKKPDYSWMIRKKKTGGKALFGGDCFYLSYESTRSVEAFCNSIHKEPMGTHAFLNIDAYESGECNVPFCWGTGNIISVLPDNAIRLLQSGAEVVTKLRSPQGLELKRRMPAPFECVKQLSDGKMFCITPDTLLTAMNQWYMGYEIEKRKLMRSCLFCGKHAVANRLICASHFTSELR